MPERRVVRQDDALQILFPHGARPVGERAALTAHLEAHHEAFRGFVEEWRRFVSDLAAGRQQGPAVSGTESVGRPC